MEEYLRSLAANKHCPIDVTFVYQVHLQLMAQETVRAREQLDLNQHQGTASLPLSLFFSPLQRQLQDLRMTMSSHLPSHSKDLLDSLRAIEEVLMIDNQPHRNAHVTCTLRRTLHQ
jgi:hypothetical protein